MKRSKEIIINRRIMHRYQQQYRLWKPIIMGIPILRINTDTIRNVRFDEKWLKYARRGILLLNNEEKSITVRRL